MAVINIQHIKLTDTLKCARTHARLCILTSPLQLELIGWMSAYGAVCIVLIVIVMTDWNNSIETIGDGAYAFG